MNSYLTNLTEIVEELKQSLLLAAHPVGSVYVSSQDDDPATLFGGTWTDGFSKDGYYFYTRTR